MKASAQKALQIYGIHLAHTTLMPSFLNEKHNQSMCLDNNNKYTIQLLRYTFLTKFILTKNEKRN